MAPACSVLEALFLLHSPGVHPVYNTLMNCSGLGYKCLPLPQPLPILVPERDAGHGGSSVFPSLPVSKVVPTSVGAVVCAGRSSGVWAALTPDSAATSSQRTHLRQVTWWELWLSDQATEEPRPATKPHPGKDESTNLLNDGGRDRLFAKQVMPHVTCGDVSWLREVSGPTGFRAAVLSCTGLLSGQQPTQLPHPSADALPSLFQGAHWKEEVW